ncbi:methyltransferase domain-containing protein [Nonomuraea sp. NPDC052129]|uniref:methyltransferase domain-containing protein n=1 Tax=Nonomuraea sp. NPDC052129 TaxID=3154651 RepID=UPI003421B8D9
MTFLPPQTRIGSLMSVLIGAVTRDRADLATPVKAAFQAVPRHLFIPARALVCADGDETVIDRDTDPDAWWSAVYSAEPIVTQLDDGATTIGQGDGGYTSSSSAPGTVANFLELLNPAPGHRILEVGTGTGWTAALLCHLLGEHGSLTSIEVDAAIAEQAAKNLGEAGAHPHLLVGDGAEGCLDRAPFDRVHVTCGIHTLPYAWIEQCRPGAVIVAPYCPGFGANHALQLTVLPDGTAQGGFPGFASYMMMRSQRTTYPPKPDAASLHQQSTRVDPRTIACAPPGATLAIAALTGLHLRTKKQDGGRFKAWLTNPADPAERAMIAWRPGDEVYPVVQVGERPVWDEAVDAYFRWVRSGRPGRTRFGMTVTPDGHSIWLDAPDNVLRRT